MIRGLPAHWRLITISDCLRRRRESVDPSEQPSTRFSFVGLEDIEGNGLGGVTMRDVAGAEIRSIKTVFHAGDVLYGKLRPYLNKTAVAPAGGICTTDVWAFQPKPFISGRFAYLVFCSRPFVARVSHLTHGANLPRLDANTFDSIQIPLPPLTEQERIVQVLQEAEAVRRLRDDADRKTAELVPAIFHDMFGEPELNSKAWPTKPLGRILLEEPQNGLYKPSTDYGSGVPIFRITDFYDGRMTTKELQRVRANEAEVETYRLHDGDILLNRVNSMEFLGKSAVAEKLTEPTIFESNMMRLTLNRDEVLPEFLIEFLQTPAALGRLRRRAKQAVNQASVNQGDVMSLLVIVPPLDLQRRFVQVVSEFRSLPRIRGSQDAGELDLGNELLASLLADAFTGELTAKWRHRQARRLEREARERDQALKLVGVMPPKASAKELEGIFETPTDGQWSELSREQRELWQFIPPQPFTAESLADDVRGTLHDRPDAVRRHLEVFCARGLLLSVTRQRLGDDQKAEFAHVYRKPTDQERQWLETEINRLAQTFAPEQKA